MLSAFMTLWTSSFVDSGLLDSQLEAQALVSSYNTYAVLATLLLVLPLGRLADTYKFTLLIAFACLLKVGAITLFMQ